ncbi:TetR/AcrR family transcriptional regulator [Micromonospora sp. DT53]|uniref:TetR/AcrR family transcriptional regulator n=1 Tax=Micromonospora sp. DT53 TaxID=3393444 RepID=UPI003CF1C041
MVRAAPDTHGEILAAAARQFTVTGYRGTSLQDIAREVGCSKATVLYHFANKEALLAELMAPAIEVLRGLDDQLNGLTGTAAQEVAATGFVDLAVRFRREIAVLRGEFPELLCQPAFAHIQQISDRLRDALAGHSDRPGARIAALVLLAGISEACAEFADIPDDELRPALLTLARRTVEPVDAPLPHPPTTEDKDS